MNRRVQSNASERDILLSDNVRHPNTKCIVIAHSMTWICVILDLFVMPIMCWTLVIILFSLYGKIPCSCWGYINEDDTTISNIGACSCFMSAWRVEDEGYCFDRFTMDPWYPQYCNGGYRSFLCAVAVLSMLLFTQYMLCVFAWTIVIAHCLAAVLFRIGWIFWCICITILHALWWCINLQINENPKEMFIKIWNDREWMKDFSITAVKKTFKNVIWETFAPQPEPEFCPNRSMKCVVVLRLINLIPWLLLVIFVSVVVPLNNKHLKHFNCGRYGTQYDGNPYTLRINSYWNRWLESNMLMWFIMVHIVLISILFPIRRLILCLLKLNITDLESNETQKFYLRMIGKKYEQRR